jgi:hypothetical protein
MIAVPRLPLIATTLAMYGHAMQRKLTYAGQYSEDVVPHISLGTGCQSSPPCARGVMKGPVSAADAAAAFIIAKQVDQASYDSTIHVDDFSQEASGGSSAVYNTITGAGRVFCLRVAECGLRISPKSVIIASSRAMAVDIKRFFMKEMHITLQVREAAEHLGHCRPAHGTRVFSSLHTRFSRAKVRNRRVGILASHSWKAQHLFTPGTLPAATYGSQVLGLPLKLQRNLDAMAAQAVGGAGTKGCSTTAVFARYGYFPSVEVLLNFI